ncbi:MAG: site-specific integrase [Acidobacteriota bacterium]|nr:site-specific integrase [Acidobacteriota bacterium]
MQAKRNPQPRRKPVPRHPGVYYRPRRGGKVAPPYELRYLDSTGVRRWEVVHGTLEDAEARRAELLLRRRRGERIAPTRQTFAEYARAWLARQHVRPRTYDKYRWALERHLIPYFGRRRLDQITSDDIAAFIAALRRKGLRGWTITSALRPLSLILGQAARKGRIPVNPLTQLERGERPRHDDQRPKRILTLEEMRAVIASADGESYRCLIELLLAAGLRIGEALGLTVADLDPKHALIRVEYQLGRDGIRTLLKTEESRRTLDIPAPLMRRLLALVDERGQLFNPQALVFASRNETGLVRKVAREALKRAAKEARLASPAPTLHDLRHSHASMLIALDYSVVDVQHRLGHRKPDTTLRVYTHQWKYREAQRSRIGAQIGQLFRPDGPAELTAAEPRRAPLALPPGRPSSSDGAAVSVDPGKR